MSVYLRMTLSRKKHDEYGIWVGKDSVSIFKFNIYFPMIKYTDEHAWKISDLKKLKVVKIIKKLLDISSVI